LRALSESAARRGNTKSAPSRVPDANPIGRWSLYGLLAGCAFAAYISLVPFQFEPLSIADIIARFQLTAEHGINSWTNFAANVLLFIPIGLFGGGWLIGGREFGLRQVLGALALAVGSIALSVTIEVLQVLVPSRTPSLADIAAQCLGTAMGAAIWLLLSRDILRWGGRLSPQLAVSHLQLALAVYVVGRTLALLLPLDVTVDVSILAARYRDGMITVNPAASVMLDGRLVQLLASSVLFCAPVGLLAAIGGVTPGTRRSVLHATVLGTAWVAMTEFAQVFIISRSADVGDLVIGACGVLVGAFLATQVTDAIGGRTRSVPRQQAWMLVGLAASIALFLVYNWAPFDFVMSRNMIRTRLGMLRQAPFYAYYLTSEWNAVWDASFKGVSGMPMGFFAAATLSSWCHQFPRLGALTLVAGGLLLTTVVEIGQVALPSRYPDPTDILIATAGILAGAQVWRLVHARSR
jgi:glycopeptide antibiotics resistance protein